MNGPFYKGENHGEAFGEVYCINTLVPRNIAAVINKPFVVLLLMYCRVRTGVICCPAPELQAQCHVFSCGSVEAVY